MRAYAPLLLALLLPVLGCTSAEPDPTPSDDDDSVETSNLYGPENRWRYATEDEVPDSRGDLDGLYNGLLASDWVFFDQFGDEVLLHQFTGRLVVFEHAAMWCGPCLDEAPDLRAFAESQGDDGAMLVTWLKHNEQGELATPEDAARWAEMTDAVHPVLSLGFDQQLVVGGNFPGLTIIDHDMIVVAGDRVPFDYAAYERAAAGTPGAAEACGDGSDNDVDLLTDCADPDCIAQAACAPAGQSAGLEPCGQLSSVTDIWEITAPAAGTTVEVDTLDPGTTFDPMIASLPSADWTEDWATLADDEFICTARPEAGRCPRGFVPGGTSWIAVGGAMRDYDQDADCNGRSSATYELRLRGGGTATLVSDDLRTGPDPDPYPTGPAHSPAAEGTLVVEQIEQEEFVSEVFTLSEIECGAIGINRSVKATFTHEALGPVEVNLWRVSDSGDFWPRDPQEDTPRPDSYWGTFEVVLDPEFPEFTTSFDYHSGQVTISDNEPRQVQFVELAVGWFLSDTEMIASGTYTCPE